MPFIKLNKCDLCCKGSDPSINENSNFLAHIPEKNKITTP